MKKLFTVFSVAALSLMLSACGGGGGGSSSSTLPPVGVSLILPSQTAANQIQTSAACDPTPSSPHPIEVWLDTERPDGNDVALSRGTVCVRASLNAAAAQMLVGNGVSGNKALAAAAASSAGYAGTVLSYVYARGAASESQCFDKLNAVSGGLLRLGQLQDVGAAVTQVAGFSPFGPEFECVAIAAAKEGAGSAGQVPVAGTGPSFLVLGANFTPDSAGPQILLSLLTRDSADRCATGNGCYPMVRSISVVSADPMAEPTFVAESSSALSVPTLSGVQAPTPQEPLTTTGGLLRLRGTNPDHCSTKCTLTVVLENDLGQTQTLTVDFDNNGEIIPPDDN